MMDGTEFEKLTEKIFAQLVKNQNHGKVEHNVRLHGKDGPRQVDVLITTHAAGIIEHKTIVECKDYKSKVSISVIDELYSVLQDLNANKGVVVSAKGFSKTAKRKAARLGISLYTAHEAMHEKWNIDIEIPMLITEITASGFSPKFSAKCPADTRLNYFFINDIDLQVEFANYWNALTPDYLNKLNLIGNVVEFEKLHPPFYVRDSKGYQIPVKDVLLRFDIEKKYYLGYLNEQKDSLALRDAVSGRFNMLVSTRDIMAYRKNFHKISFDEIPTFNMIKWIYFVKRTVRPCDYVGVVVDENI